MAGVAVTLVVHLLLLLGWTMARRPPALEDGPRTAITWIDLPAPVALPAPRRVASPAAPSAAPAAAQRRPVLVAPTISAPAPAITVAPPASLSADAPAPPGAETIMERARRSAGAVDRALRKENRPYIVAPLDSPQIRMQNGMAKAHDMAPPKLWEAPKVEEMVNQTGDGMRRTRVITGNGTYCISERATNASVETIERHGKLRLTNCAQHEDTATQQEWRTARD
ncbi:hypothetical protein [Massilia sp. S19_KUP03_FR1]|uniref:hypothetical protein n=1 Tax=Massilia sp. S19_KUP03_FR1 TaxID=3025503 RepID=UPI002FCD3A0C